MPLLTIGGHHVDFPSAQAIPGPEVDFVLNWLKLQRLQNRMAVWMRKQTASGTIPTHAEFQAELLRLDAEFSWSDSDDPGAVEAEARVIASETILARLAQANLPPPRDLEPHISHLLTANPHITALARERVIARVEAAREILGTGP